MVAVHQHGHGRPALRGGLGSLPRRHGARIAEDAGRIGVVQAARGPGSGLGQRRGRRPLLPGLCQLPGVAQVGLPPGLQVGRHALRHAGRCGQHARACRHPHHTGVGRRRQQRLQHALQARLHCGVGHVHPHLVGLGQGRAPVLALRAFGLGRALQGPLQVLHLPAQALALAFDLRRARRRGDVCRHPQQAARCLGSAAAHQHAQGQAPAHQDRHRHGFRARAHG